ncbi:hypothetical protein BLA24_29570 [Streptomyces cinnamoneus]|uniref:Uncharacterized protein n=1 Tax=Streptomyces cinnamoneus TaxID=53446 RepID=A0A2G1XB87_STRCJ|nr:hypothetical protein [Streptomyces cinnamoneus]PHQ48507.1 hypothetical protein BLA24_29570 [Streptomyces cinnamoneus]PPT12494.1 hypothetical protein CYQ11_05905 [Streptomyces cinnamoneus]
MAGREASGDRQAAVGARPLLAFNRELSDEEVRQLQSRHDAIGALLEPPSADDDHCHHHLLPD